MKNPILIAKAITFGWADHIKQHRHFCVFHGGLVLDELFWGITHTTLQYKNNCVLIDTRCTTGIIPNTITYVQHTTSYSIEMLLQQLEVATTTAFDLKHGNIKVQMQNSLMASSAIKIMGHSKKVGIQFCMAFFACILFIYQNFSIALCLT